MKLTYLNRHIFYIPSVVLTSKSNQVNIIINTDISIVRKELEIVLKPIENKSLLKLNVYNFNDYLYKFYINKKDNIHEIYKIPEYLLNYHSKSINSYSFLDNI